MSKAGDWRCPCGTNNFAKRLNCIECHRAKAKCVTTDHPGDWWCPMCHIMNFSYRTECKTCQRPKPVTPSWDQTPPAVTKWKEGDWRCPCGTVNFASRSACFKCGLSKAPSASAGDPTDPQLNQSSVSTSSSDPKPTAAPPQGKPGDWNCPCGTLNFAHRGTCFKCNTPKGATPIQQQQQLQGGSPPPSASLPSATTPATGVAQSFDRKPGDWNCPQCSFVNFGSRRVCMKCGTDNPATTSPPPASLPPSGVGKAAVDINGAGVGLPSYFAPPAYWRLSTSAAPPAATKGGVPSLYEVYEDPAIDAMVRQLFASDAPSLKVAQVRRLENPVLWQSYRAECGRLVAKYGDRGCQPLPPQVAPTTLLNYLKDDLKINEVLLMHGTRPEVGLTIMNNGFDPSHSGEASGSLYGQGTYFSDSLKKVLQYSKGCILVSRVALGEPALPPFQNPHTFRRPPVKPAGTAGTSGAPDEYDCVIGGSTYKEFIVYRHTKAYPEFVIFHAA